MVLDRADILACTPGTSNLILFHTDLMGTFGTVSIDPGVEQTAYGVFSDLVSLERRKTMKRAIVLLLLGRRRCSRAEQQLFNGKDLSGWARIPRHEGAPANQKPGFEVHDGLLVSLPDAPEDDLWYTREKIGNATLRVVYKVSAPDANSGIFIRIPMQPKSEDDAINKGIEVQIDEHGDDYHCTGVLYSMTQAKARPYKPAGEWNTLEITMQGPRTIVKLNGVLVTDYDGVSPVPPKKGQYEPDRGPRPDTGYIAVQHHGGARDGLVQRNRADEVITAKRRGEERRTRGFSDRH